MHSGRPSFSSAWASLFGKPSARDGDGTSDLAPLGYPSPLDKDFDDYFADPRPHDFTYRPRREINPFVEAQRLGQFTSYKPVSSTISVIAPSSPIKRKLSDADGDVQAAIAESRQRFLDTSHQACCSSGFLSSTSIPRVARQGVSEIGTEANHFLQNATGVQNL
jgi:hypothetical protein